MLVYWLLFFIPLLALVYPARNSHALQNISWLFAGIFFTLIIGFRYEVGGDWSSYLDKIYTLEYLKESGATWLAHRTIGNDAGYSLLNWFSVSLGGGIYLVNLVCACIFMAGIMTFCKRQPVPWLALLIAVPYIIIVLGMGYTRQGVAFGFELLALNAFANGRLRRFVILIILGALFHKSLVLLLPLAAVANSRNRLLTLTWVSVTVAVAGLLLLQEHHEAMWNNYVTRGRESDGGPIRVAMNAIPAAMILLFRHRLFPRDNERKLYICMALAALACIPLVFLASTAVDRMALYLMPIQIALFARLPFIFRNTLVRSAFTWGIVAFYALIEFVWLNFASHAHAWLPYQFAWFK